MKPEEIPPVNPISGNMSRGYEPNHPSADPAEINRNKQANRDDKVRIPQLDHVQLNKLESSNTDTEHIALEIRKVNQSMEAIDTHLLKMRTALESIVKIYPPYPPGSSERIEALRQFSSFRKLIDQIANPPKASGIESILGDPRRNPRAGDWSLRIDGRKSDLVIRHQPVHPQNGGLDIPEMNTASSDSQISNAIQKTTSALQALSSRRRDFMADANQVIFQIS